MATKQGFVRDAKAIGDILKTDPGIAAALDEEAAKLSGKSTKRFTTDRQIVVVLFDAEDQAVNGVATKALGRRGRTLT